MRTFKDRIRHTVLFEFLALGIAAFGGAWILDRPVETIGALSLMFSLLAMGWNLAFNWLFDHWDQRYRNAAARGVLLRMVHASLFELGMVIAGIFLTAWWLGISYWEALIIDIGFSAFFLVYAFCFNWLYEVIFPIPKPSASPV